MCQGCGGWTVAGRNENKKWAGFKSSGWLMGFVDLGNVNEELQQLARVIQGDQQTPMPINRTLAKYMLVLMVQSIARPSLTFHVAHYPTAS